LGPLSASVERDEQDKASGDQPLGLFLQLSVFPGALVFNRIDTYRREKKREKTARSAVGAAARRRD
jgi:hypothetical protein